MKLKSHPSFEGKRIEPIESLNLTYQEYQHRETGAQHIHLQSDNKENVFLVAFRTVPQDSTGVAHILEHTALCGSEKFPVRDPFFMMIRRSLNTFMNALTSSDWTAYPFASQNLKDFNNLLEVYLDSVFFARLDPLDFAQEGHRLEFSEPDNDNSELTFKGVVFNEMKGAMSSINSILWQSITKHLYPTNTYHFNSGGDPAHIPDLTYDQFMGFYRVHYHPSNAIFLTFGSIPAEEHQQKFQDLALKRFERLNCNIAVQDERRYEKPQYFREPYAFSKTESSDKKTHIVLGWLLGDYTNLEDTMEARLLSSVLLDNSGSPLMNALESTDLGAAPSPMCGLEDSQKQLCFVCGVEGSEENNADDVEAMILSIIESVAENGLPLEQVTSSLHQIELQQREISGGGYPYGLSLILTALTGAAHRGDPIAHLNLDPVLQKLQRKIQDPEFIKSLARRLLHENTHRIRLVLYPDVDLGRRRDHAEKKKLSKLKASLSNSEKKVIIDRARQLKDRQEAAEDLEILPKVTVGDVPPDIAYAEKLKIPSCGIPLTAYSAGTNGLVYEQIIIPFPDLSDEQLMLLPLYTQCVSQLGVGDLDYRETQLWQAGIVGSYSASASIRADKDDLGLLRGNLCYSAKGLARNQLAMTQLLDQSLRKVKFSESQRLREIVSQIRAGREASLVGNGHLLAMNSAASELSLSAHLNHRWNGLPGISWIKELDGKVQNADCLARLSKRLNEIHRIILQQPRQYVLISEGPKIPSFIDVMENIFSAGSVFKEISQDESQITYQPPLAAKNVCWTTNTQVSFCAKAYPTVASTHKDAPALTVLGGVLRNGYLHTKIREQGGAYGSGASQDNQNGTFRFFSYRDPRIKGTLQDFDESVNWLLGTDLSDEKVEEAILGVISTLDKPGSPAGEAMSAFHGELNGRNKEQLMDFRDRVLSVKSTDLKAVAENYLKPEMGFSSVITNTELCEESEMEIISV